MARPRLPRTELELVSRLKAHCDLLDEYYQKACVKGDEKYFGEIAGKLRVLVYRNKSNRPLLLDLMETAGIGILVQLNKPRGLSEQTLEEFIDGFQCAIRLPSGNLAELSRRDLISLWAQQYGAAHEDWKLDERLVAALTQGLHIGDQQIARRAICSICRTVLRVSRHFLSIHDSKHNITIQ